MERRSGVESGGESCEEPIELEEGQQLSDPGSLDSEEVNRWLDEMDDGKFAELEGQDATGVPDCFMPESDDEQEENAPKR